jgi:hypothetical protein
MALSTPPPRWHHSRPVHRRSVTVSLGSCHRLQWRTVMTDDYTVPLHCTHPCPPRRSYCIRPGERRQVHKLQIKAARLKAHSTTWCCPGAHACLRPDSPRRQRLKSDPSAAVRYGYRIKSDRTFASQSVWGPRPPCPDRCDTGVMFAPRVRGGKHESVVAASQQATSRAIAKARA